MIEQDENQSSTPNLPALIPSSSLILNRTQTAIGLLRDVVQESSAEYWYKLGEKASEQEDWDKAIYNYDKCVRLRDGTLIIKALENLCTSYKNRAEYRAYEGDVEGSALDWQWAIDTDDYMEHMIAVGESFLD